MEISEKFGFFLPSRDSDDVADINQISENFRKIETGVPKTTDIEPLVKRYTSNTFSNALIGKITGSAVRADDVSPVEHGPAVSVRSKNLYNNTACSQSNTYVTSVVDTNDVTLTVTGGQGTAFMQYWAYWKDGVADVVGQTVTFSVQSWNVTDTSAAPNILIYCQDSAGANIGTNSNIYLQSSTTLSVTFTVPENTAQILFLFRVDQNKTCPVGTVFTVNGIMLELGNTATAYTPYVPPESVTVSRYGKNLFDLTALSKSSSYVTYESGVNDLTMTTTGGVGSAFMQVLASQTDGVSGLIGQTLTLSVVGYSTTDAAGIAVVIVNFLDSSGTSISDTSAQIYLRSQRSTTFVVPEGTEQIRYIFRCDQNQAVPVGTVVTINGIMLELGDAATGYEAYKQVLKLPAYADGTVGNVNSVSPSMTIVTNREGALIDCQYTRDINKVLAGSGYISELPAVTTADNGKVLTVVNGVWTAATVSSTEAVAVYDGSVTIEGATETISFTIDGTSYEAEEGMTWSEWVESDYNTGGFTQVLNTYYNEYYIGLNVTYFVEGSTGWQKPADTIVSGYAYTLVLTGD